MNVQDIRAIAARCGEILTVTGNLGDSAKKTHLKFQMIKDEAEQCIAQRNSRKPYLLELMLKDCIVQSMFKADLCRPTWNGRPVTFTTDADVHQRAVDASEKLGIDIMI